MKSVLTGDFDLVEQMLTDEQHLDGKAYTVAGEMVDFEVLAQYQCDFVLII
ncbi:unnamed protein product [Periconia digitata]|uniref:Uncharacterized protein n=1 Tax=Periconia digitata TaxID=1303443 RepID=A0A9W4UQF2_9PLEO|nr:unnamed protein product [Periconia digitata]